MSNSAQKPLSKPGSAQATKLAAPSSGRPGMESRRTPRRQYHRSIGVLCQGSYQVLQAVQLSEGGMLFASTSQFTEKDQVVISLIIPGGGAVVARGEIIYNIAKDKSYGVKFAPLPLHLRRLIRNYVTAKTQEEAEQELM